MSASLRRHYRAKSFMTARININASALAFAPTAINLKHRCSKAAWQKRYLTVPLSSTTLVPPYATHTHQHTLQAVILR